MKRNRIIKASSLCVGATFTVMLLSNWGETDNMSLKCIRKEVTNNKKKIAKEKA